MLTMKNLLRIFVLGSLLFLSFCGILSAQINGSPTQPPQPPQQEQISYQTALEVWTEAQPHFWPHLRMTVNDLMYAYFRNGEGEIEKLGGGNYRAEMRGCIITVAIGDAL